MKPPFPPKHRAGAGLGQLFPSEEAITARRAVLAPEEVTVEGQILCPACGGSARLRVSQWDTVPCPECRGAGTTTREAFDAWIAAHPESLAAKQLAKPKP